MTTRWTCAMAVVAFSLLAFTAQTSLSHPPEFHQRLALQEKPAPAQKDGKKKPARTPDFVYDRADETVESTVWEKPDWYDADVLSRGDSLLYAWLEFTPGRGDTVWLGERKEDVWVRRSAVLEKQGSYACPTLTEDAHGGLWLSYEAEHDGQWDVMLARLGDDLTVAAPRRISPGAGADIRHRVAADADGGLWFVWQSDQGGQFDILARRMAADAIAEPLRLSRQARGDWHPAIAVGKDGACYVVWDAHDGVSYNVRLCTIHDNAASEPIDVAASPAFEGRADVAADREGRIWIVWEEGGENWGKPYRPKLLTTNISDQLGPLHRFRRLRFAVYSPEEERLEQIDDRLPMPSLQAAAERKDVSPGVRYTGAFYERAKLTFDRRGRLWVAYRHFYTPWLGVVHRSHVEAGWGVYLRALGGDGWSDLYQLDVGQGDGMQRLELAPHGDAVAAVWTTGRTHREKSKRPRGVVTADVDLPGEDVGELTAIPAKRQAAADDAARYDEVEERPNPVTVGGKEYQLFFGDLHRHTDLSLCRVPIDGTIDDAYRYAIDAARLDFLGITDHSRDLALGNALSQLWWRNRKEVYRHQLGDVFIPYYAYERSHGNTADHNVISLRGDMLRPHTYPVPEFWKEIDPETTITIPHQPIRRDTWAYQDDARRPLVEIYQGARGRVIAEDVHRGLAKGYHLGIIASSDHMSTSASYACVWAEDASRESIFQALRARRTFGATAKIRLLLRSGEHWMGERIAPSEEIAVELAVSGTAPIRSVNFLIDGKVVKTYSPARQTIMVRETFPVAGARYIYAEVLQGDGNMAWSSPIWLDGPAAAVAP